MEYFKKLDFVGHTITFEHKGSERFKTYTGAFLSIVLFVFCFVSFFIIGEDIWKKKKPLIQNTMIQTEDSRINLYKFPIIISGYDANIQNIQNIEEYIYWELHETIGPLNELSEDGNPKVNINKHKIEKCNITEMYPKDFGEYNYDGITLFCPSFSNNKDSYIQDPIYSQKSLSYIIKIFKCDINKSKCASDLEEKFEKIRIFITLFEEIINAQNFTNPVIRYETNYDMFLSNMLFKEMKINLEKGQFKNDIGWFFEDIKPINFIKVQSKDIIYSISNSQDNHKLSFTLNSINEITYITRSYIKLNEIFAKVGGLLNAAVMILYVLSYHYIRFYYLIFIEETLTNNQNQQISNFKENFDQSKIPIVTFNKQNDFESKIFSKIKKEILFLKENMKRSDNEIINEIGDKEKVSNSIIHFQKKVKNDENFNPIQNKNSELNNPHNSLDLVEYEKSFSDYIFSKLFCIKLKNSFYSEYHKYVENLMEVENYLK